MSSPVLTFLQYTFLLGILNAVQTKIAKTEERSGRPRRSGIMEQLKILHDGAARREIGGSKEMGVGEIAAARRIGDGFKGKLERGNGEAAWRLWRGENMGQLWILHAGAGRRREIRPATARS
jgi:hypothetical protein